ncbi:tRNA(His) guanylyltransferase Thg1 family protein [Planomonospora sp. ID82291]|uniref:tRNA(His) guanylyltransferase Thg1 family protein n=1 Tax=Planomonospora sp. ID82291 TaxID=2738136 RepID=UPI0018C3725D|nr:tRNA(His) guanylyltransferase Thg1 family protein [Planomonospora sp. ID82291]MBG0818265.1 hypothetical protein [Planomonospora sp. ID82291]
MSDTTALGDRMKGYEHVTRGVLPRRTYTIIRVDGRAFHTFLAHADRPFDEAVVEAMNAVAVALCGQAQGAVFAYTQSDECSLLLTDFASRTTQPWFGGVIQKIASISAAVASVAFNQAYGYHYDDACAVFDARVFTLPDAVEVANYFLWRQRDCVRNSITMAAQARFSHRQLQGVTTEQMQEMLWQGHGINWNDYPAGMKRGRVIVRDTAERDITYTDRRTSQTTTTQVLRSAWTAQDAPHFTADPSGWLAATIPAQAALAPAAPAATGHFLPEVAGEH